MSDTTHHIDHMGRLVIPHHRSHVLTRLLVSLFTLALALPFLVAGLVFVFTLWELWHDQGMALLRQILLTLGIVLYWAMFGLLSLGLILMSLHSLMGRSNTVIDQGRGVMIRCWWILGFPVWSRMFTLMGFEEVEVRTTETNAELRQVSLHLLGGERKSVQIARFPGKCASEAAELSREVAELIDLRLTESFETVMSSD